MTLTLKLDLVSVRMTHMLNIYVKGQLIRKLFVLTRRQAQTIGLSGKLKISPDCRTLL